MIIPFAEWLPDMPDLQGGGSKKASNVVPMAKSYAPLPAPTAASDALDNECVGSIALKDSGGTVRVLAGDSGKLYLLEDGSFSDVSKVGGYVALSDRWEFQRWGDKVIAVNISEPPQVIDLMAGSPVFADLGGSPEKARHIAVVRDFVVMGNVDDGANQISNKVKWSGINDETAWTPSAATQSDEQLLQGDGGAIQAIVGGEYGVIVQEDSIWRMTYVGSPLVFQFDEIETGRGTSAPASVVALGSMVFYLGKDGFYVFDGNSSTNISANKVGDHFYNDLDASFIDKITAAIDPKNTLVIWSYPSIESGGTPDKVIIYNWTTGKWSEGSVALQQVTYSRQTDYTLDSMDTILPSIDVDAPSFDSRYWKGGAILLAGFNTDNKLVVFTGEPLTGVIETDEMQITDSAKSLITSVRPLIDGDCTLRIAYRDRLKDPVLYSDPITPDDDGRAYCLVHGRYHRIEITTSGDFDHAQGVKVFAETMGEF